ncbi:hypothetical protein BDC45DRAFT_594688 [Circinella umbellata]|nr:hypothetical protein BDC45DRAFT_594688 [Circinella umbellata]
MELNEIDGDDDDELSHGTIIKHTALDTYNKNLFDLDQAEQNLIYLSFWCDNNNILQDCSAYTKYDHIIKVWGYVFESLFKNSTVKLKWGESVPPHIMIAKMKSRSAMAKVISYKVDLRGYVTVDKKTFDVLNVEFVKLTVPISKYLHDHSKLLCESKVILDAIYNIGELSRWKGEIIEIDLAKSGLYITNHKGSLQILYGLSRLDSLETWIERVLTVKTCIAQKQERAASMNKKMNQPDSLDREIQGILYKNFTHSTWFPPLQRNQDHLCHVIPPRFSKFQPTLHKNFPKKNQ